MGKTIIGVMGGSADLPFKAIQDAHQLGKLIAEEGWVLLNGGRNSGIMDASARGAKEGGGLTVGILPDRDASRASSYLDIRIISGLGDARNYINVLSSDVVVACPGREGTISEVALALKNGKTVILLDFDLGDIFDRFEHPPGAALLRASTPQEAIALIKAYLQELR